MILIDYIGKPYQNTMVTKKIRKKQYNTFRYMCRRTTNVPKFIGSNSDFLHF